MYSKGFHSLLTLAFVCFVAASTGCATIVKGTNQKIPIASSPSNADVYVDGNLKGSTPVDVQMKRKRDHLVTIEKPGYQEKSVPVVKDVGGAVWGNILLGGLIGWGVDAITGAQYNLNPKTISVKLEAATGSDAEAESLNESAEFVQKLNNLDDLLESKRLTPEEYLSLRTALFKQYFPELLPEESEPIPELAKGELDPGPDETEPIPDDADPVIDE